MAVDIGPVFILLEQLVPGDHFSFITSTPRGHNLIRGDVVRVDEDRIEYVVPGEKGKSGGSYSFQKWIFRCVVQATFWRD